LIIFSISCAFSDPWFTFCDNLRIKRTDVSDPDAIANNYATWNTETEYELNYESFTSTYYEVTNGYITKVGEKTVESMIQEFIDEQNYQYSLYHISDENYVLAQRMQLYLNNREVWQDPYLYSTDLEAIFHPRRWQYVLHWDGSSLSIPKFTIEDFNNPTKSIEYKEGLLENVESIVEILKSYFERPKSIGVVWNEGASGHISCYASGLATGICGAKSASRDIYQCKTSLPSLSVSNTTASCDGNVNVTLNNFNSNDFKSVNWSVNGASITGNWTSGILVSKFTKNGSVTITCTAVTQCDRTISRTTTINVTPDYITDVYGTWGTDITSTLLTAPDCNGNASIRVTAPYFASYSYEYANDQKPLAPNVIGPFSAGRSSTTFNTNDVNDLLKSDIYVRVGMKTNCSVDSKIIKIPYNPVPVLTHDARICGNKTVITVNPGNSQLVGTPSFWSNSGDVTLTPSGSKAVSVTINNPSTFSSATIYAQVNTMNAGIACSATLQTTVSKENIAQTSATAKWQAGWLTSSADSQYGLLNNFVISNSRKIYGLYNANQLAEYAFDNSLNKWQPRLLSLSNKALATTGVAYGSFGSQAVDYIFYMDNTYSMKTYNLTNKSYEPTSGGSGPQNAVKYAKTFGGKPIYTTTGGNLVQISQNNSGYFQATVIIDNGAVKSHPLLIGNYAYFADANGLKYVDISNNSTSLPKTTVINMAIKAGSNLALDNNGNLLLVNSSGNIVALDKAANPAFSSVLTTPMGNGLVSNLNDCSGDFVVNTSTGTIFYYNEKSDYITLQTIAKGKVAEVTTSTALNYDGVNFAKNLIYSTPNVFYMSNYGYADNDVWNLFYDEGCKPTYYRIADNENSNDKASTLNLAPNPANEQITISYSDGSLIELDIEILSMTGTKVVGKNIANNSALSIESLSSGLYYVLVKNQGTVLATTKFVKQ
jgi:hypothetical protein